ncbi:Uma2 family endonuclease [Rhodocaloribacter litoris]|uniref:Uma2 family endonuclease n=1 Tax=Rhodocaloribacter litoris TaxID=2558931 RepID=UPI001424A381|nr:Uma2 family endonuclease [Rhodocaloribacter litoris]QXD16436.1 Uma2 family endonuclease [Rhodocaloribacter litoris]
MIKTIPGAEGPILRLSRHRWTYADLQAMGETMERYEIIDGVLYMSPSAHVRRHQQVVTHLLFVLKSWVSARNLGEVFTAPADVVVSPERVVQPDVFFITAERMHIVDAYVDGAPDLIMEVVSPSSVDYDRVTKFDLYEEIGVREYWIVDPQERCIDVFSLNEGRYGTGKRFGPGEEAASVLLPGFTVLVDEVLPSDR